MVGLIVFAQARARVAVATRTNPLARCGPRGVVCGNNFVGLPWTILTRVQQTQQSRGFSVRPPYLPPPPTDPKELEKGPRTTLTGIETKVIETAVKKQEAAEEDAGKSIASSGPPPPGEGESVLPSPDPITVSVFTKRVDPSRQRDYLLWRQRVDLEVASQPGFVTIDHKAVEPEEENLHVVVVSGGMWSMQ